MTNPKKWLRITFSCPDKITEAAADLVGIISGVGVNIRPSKSILRNEISGYFKLDAGDKKERDKESFTILCKAGRELVQLFKIYNLQQPDLETEIIDDQDWATSWQQYFTPFEIVPGLVIKPTWEEYAPEKDQHVLEMDPGMAFGTGQHESTRLALSLLSSRFKMDRDKLPGKVLDVGTGTGILAMAAAIFGAEHVTAIDNDPQAVDVAVANINLNGLDKKVRTSDSPLNDIQDSYELICANIVHDVLVAMAQDFKRILVPGGHIILAGILQGEQESNILNIYNKLGMGPVQVEHEGEWTGILSRSTG